VIGVKTVIKQTPPCLWSWNTDLCGSFCAHLYVGFTEWHQEHFLPCHAIAAHVLHFLVGMKQSLSNISVHCKTCFDVELYRKCCCGIPTISFSKSTSEYFLHVNVKGNSLVLLHNEKQPHQLNTTVRLRISSLQWH
jgi:hypothetical protein